MASQYVAGYTDAEEKYEPELAKKDATIAELRAELEKYKKANK